MRIYGLLTDSKLQLVTELPGNWQMPENKIAIKSPGSGDFLKKHTSNSSSPFMASPKTFPAIKPGDS